MRLIFDNFSTHVSNRVKKKMPGSSFGVYLVYHPQYSPDLNPIEFVWKGIKRVVSISFVENVEVLREIIEKAFHSLAKRLSFAKSWIGKFVSSWF